MSDEKEVPVRIVLNPVLIDAIRRNAIAAKLMEEDVSTGVPTITFIIALLAVDEDSIKFYDKATAIYLETSDKLRILGNEIAKHIEVDINLIASAERFKDVIESLKKEK